MKKKLIPLILLASLFFGCKHEKEDASSFYMLDCRYSDKMEIRLSDFAESIEFIPLETTEESLISTILKIRSTPDYYYITHSNMSSATHIRVFDKKGNYIQTINKIGEGPDEYPYISDFLIDAEGNLVIATQFKLLTYSPDYSSLLYMDKTYAYWGFLTLEKDNNILLYNKCTSISYAESQTIDNIFLRFDKNRKTESFYRPTEDQHNRMRYTTLSELFSTCEDKVFFHYPYCDTIYEITGKSLKPVYVADFGDKKLPANIFDGTEGNIRKMFKKIEQNEGVFLISGFQQFSKGLYIGFDNYQHHAYLAFFNPETNSRILGNIIHDDLIFKGSKYKLKYSKPSDKERGLSALGNRTFNPPEILSRS